MKTLLLFAASLVALRAAEKIVGGPFVVNATSRTAIVVYGDTRTRHDVHRNVMQTLVKHGIPDFVMHTGDLVADGGDTSLWPIFFDIEKDLLRQTVFFPSL